MKLNMESWLAASVAVPVLVFVMGCASELGDWESATAAGTVEALEEFLREHPQSPLADSAGMLAAVVTIEGKLVDQSGLPVTGLEIRMPAVHVGEDGSKGCVTAIGRNEETGKFEVASPRTETDDAGRFTIVADRSTFEEEGFCIEVFGSALEAGLASLYGGAVGFAVPENERAFNVGEITMRK